MMGASVPPSGEFGSFYQLLALLDDNEAYTKKVQELDNRVQTAQKTLEQATENNRRAEEHRKTAQEMLTAANLKVEEANVRVTDATKLADAAAHNERDVKAREDQLEVKRAEILAEFSSKRDALDKENKDREDKLHRSNANFIAEQQAIALKIEARWHAAADKEAAVNKREGELVRLIAENEDTRTKLSEQMHELNEKVAKLKAIAGA